MTYSSLPKRRTKPRRTAREENPQHRKWVRGFKCCVDNGECSLRIECAHVRGGTDGGMGKKPSDKFTIPLCDTHHAEQHRIGEAPFAKRYGLNLLEIAARLWAQSPYGKKLEAA